MKALISVLAVSLASSAIASGSNIEPRIINGTDASLSDWPFLVSLRNSSGDHVCAGAYIGDNLILTASQCLDSNAGEIYQIGYGSAELDQQTVIIDPATDWSMRGHYGYAVNNGNFANDIALIKFTGTVPNSLQAIALADSEFLNALMSDADLNVAGWGDTVVSVDSASNMLQETILNPVSDATCATAYGNDFDNQNMLCAVSKNKTTVSDACKGDSGGPLVFGSGATATLVGFVSWGESCANLSKPGVYAKVSAFEQWIAASKNSLASGISYSVSNNFTFNDEIFADDGLVVKTISLKNNSNTSIALSRVYSDADSISTSRGNCGNDIISAETCDITLSINAADLHRDKDVDSQTHLFFGPLNASNQPDTANGGFAMNFTTQYLLTADISKTNAASILGNYDYQTTGYGLWTENTESSSNFYQSAAILDNQFTDLITSEITGPGTLSMQAAVSSEATHDSLQYFFNDDTLAAFSLSGECNWQDVEVYFPAGAHTIKMRYFKDDEISTGDDKSAIRDVNFVADTRIAEEQGTVISWTVNGSANASNVDCSEPVGSVFATPTPTPTPTVAPTATATTTPDVNLNKSSGNFGFIALCSLLLLRIRKMKYLALAAAALTLTACGGNADQIAALEAEKTKLNQEVSSLKMQLMDAKNAAPVAVTGDKKVLNAEPLSFINIEKEFLSFRAKDNGCTKAEDFKVELTNDEQLHVKRLKADDCRRTTTWTTFKVRHNFQGKLLTVANPMINSTIVTADEASETPSSRISR